MMRWMAIAVLGCLCSVGLAQTTQPAVSQAQAGATTDPSMVMDLKLRQPHAAPKPGQVLEMTIEQLGNFPYDYDQAKRGVIPADVQALDGCTIQTHGYMFPLDKVDHIAEFVLIPSLDPLEAHGGNWAPPVQRQIIVHMPPGKEMAKYTTAELVVEGKLKIAETKDDDGWVVCIFEINASSVLMAK
jgi:hypothetical protein